MPAERPEHPVPNRRRFLAAAAGATGLAAAPIREEPEQVIPLNTVVATCHYDQGVLEVPWKLFAGDDNLAQLFSPLKVGPSNLLLVTGSDIEAAVRATRNEYIGGARADVLRLPRLAGRGEAEGGRVKLWAFFHFGAAQTGPIEWAVKRVAVRGAQVRVTVTRPTPAERARVLLDHKVYMVWVPLGEPTEKAYTLQAYDETNRVTMMTRHVMIES
jgi:hypothetical protein